MNKVRGQKIFLVLIFLLLSLAVLFLNYYPHYYGLIKTPENFFYSGQASWFDPWDINNYFATIRWAQEKGSLLLENFNTTQPSSGTLIYPLYMIAGNIFPKINHVVLYQAMAIMGGLLLCVVIFISSYCLFRSSRIPPRCNVGADEANKKQSRGQIKPPASVLGDALLKNAAYSLVALVLISLGGGLGWAFSLPGQAADINIPGVTFFSQFQKPHEAVAAILHIFSLVFFLLSVKKGKYRLNLGSLALLILLIPCYFYRLLSYFLICGLFVLILSHQKKGDRSLFWLGLNLLVALPLGFLYLWHFMSSGFSVLSSYQRAPISIFSLILGYAWFLPIFTYQLFRISLKEKTKVFLNIWFLVSLALSLLPLGMSRLFLSSLLFPLVLINLLTLQKMAKDFPLNSYLIILMLLIFTPLSSLYIFNKRIKEAGGANVWFYLPREIKAGFEFLEKRKGDGGLALPLMASYLPVQTGKGVYFGHQDQTPNFQEKLTKAIKFYSGKFSSAEAERFLKENQINFIVYSDEEKQIGQIDYPFLKSVYKNEKIEIFEY